MDLVEEFQDLKPLMDKEVKEGRMSQEFGQKIWGIMVELGRRSEGRPAPRLDGCNDLSHVVVGSDSAV